MRLERYGISRCRICGQGDVIIVREIKTQIFSLMCDDCFSQWKNPEALFSNEGDEEESDLQLDFYEDEIEESGWVKYVTNIFPA